MSKGLQTLDFSFEGDALTHFGGLFLIQRFCNKLRLRRRLQRILKPAPNWIDFRPEDMITTLLYVLIAGIQRLNKTEILQYNGLFLSLIGLKRFPDQTALRRFLKRLPPSAIRQMVRLHDQLRTELFAIPKARTQLEFHLDSVVLTVYGKQQGARKATIQKEGPPFLSSSSGVLRLTVRNSGTVLCGRATRPVTPGPDSWCSAVWKSSLHIARSRIRWLADSGYFSGKLIDDLDQAGCGYLSSPQGENFLPMAHRAGFKKMHFGWGVAEFDYTPQKWKQDHRFIVVRRPRKRIPMQPIN